MSRAKSLVTIMEAKSAYLLVAQVHHYYVHPAIGNGFRGNFPETTAA